MRILIDTNLWIRALISNSTRERIGKLIENPAIEILGSQTLLDEIKDVASRPRLQKFLSHTDVTKFLEILVSRMDLISPTLEIKACRDPKDDFLLSIAKEFAADFLLTEDEDLLVLHPFEGIEILRLFDFEQKISLS